MPKEEENWEDYNFFFLFKRKNFCFFLKEKTILKAKLRAQIIQKKKIEI